MKALSLVLAALACLVAPAAFACDRDYNHGSMLSVHSPAYWSHRHDLDDARFAISNRSDKVVMMITDRTVALQLSDRVMHKLDRRLRDDDDGDDQMIGRVIKTAVLTSVRSVLNHSAEVDIRDISRADYRNGEIVLVAKNGHRIFRRIDVDDDNVMADFSDADSRAFVRELRERMAKLN